MSTTLIISCGALAREINALIKQHALTHITVQCLPATLHNTPDRIPGAVQSAIAAARGKFQNISVAYADCGTGGALDRILHDEKIERLPGPHCYAFYTGTESFLAAGDREMRSFFLTDFLARQFETLVIKPLGLDRYPSLRETYFGQYETIVYLAQSDDPILDEAAENAAKFLKLKYRRNYTGFGELGDYVVRAGGTRSRPPPR